MRRKQEMKGIPMTQRKDNKLSLEEHLELAMDLSIALHHLHQAGRKCSKHYRMTHPLMRAFGRVHPFVLDGVFSKLISILDNEWYRILTEEQFIKYGFIHYNLQSAYRAGRILTRKERGQHHG